MAATWTPCWRVTYGVGYTLDGEPLVEYEASRTQRSVTTRKPGTKKPVSRYKPADFDETYGATPDEAIEKYLEHWRFKLQQAKGNVEAMEIMVRRAEELQARLAQLPSGPRLDVFMPSLEMMRKMVEEPQ